MNKLDLQDPDINNVQIKVCSRCIYDERVSNISFDANGICNYCHQVDKLKEEYGTGKSKGTLQLNKILDKIKLEGANKKYDCIVGVSGGTDSSYLLYLAKKWGLRPLAVHFDNTWNTAIATMNIHKLLNHLEIDLYTYVVDNKEMDDIIRSFILAGVAESEAPNDLGFAYLLRIAARKYSIKYILEGHSFTEEGITPLGRNYFDGKYIKSIHQKFGKRKMKTYPLMTFTRFLTSIIFDQVKFIRPLWYISYSKKDAQEHLNQLCGWEYYGGHHLENRSAAFFHTIYLPGKFNSDFRNNTISSQVRIGNCSREDGWSIYNTAPIVEPDLLTYVKKRLEISDIEFEHIMNKQPLSWKDYPTYKKRFERLKGLFYLLAKLNLVPKSFYIKYCS
ncbi:N-acetyl sugar amidotransferase [Prochlorococcus marinus]|uniref:N-acetyl sugar amidotransferase n=1 Tax=Prochlorococcus marinus TaxID=1219 RepID=UPI0022B5AA57|nr:N-acetyl sugar amidotransferase [Prochlorococcus marinus]